jgi:hypothetical protein
MSHAVLGKLNDVQAMALALERLRRAADVLLTAHAEHLSISAALDSLERAYTASGQDTHKHLVWAQKVLDGSAPQRLRVERKRETFDQLRARAVKQNIFVHFVHTFEGSEYAVYRGREKVAHAKTPIRCMAVIRAHLRGERDE